MTLRPHRLRIPGAMQTSHPETVRPESYPGLLALGFASPWLAAFAGRKRPLFLTVAIFLRVPVASEDVGLTYKGTGHRWRCAP